MLYTLLLLGAISTPENVVNLAEEDVQTFFKADGLRYLSLHHIEPDLRDDYIKVVSYVLNSVSSNRHIVLPAFVDEEKTLIRFNINNYRITKEGYDSLGKNKVFKI